MTQITLVSVVSSFTKYLVFGIGNIPKWPTKQMRNI